MRQRGDHASVCARTPRRTARRPSPSPTRDHVHLRRRPRPAAASALRTRPRGSRRTRARRRRHRARRLATEIQPPARFRRASTPRQRPLTRRARALDPRTPRPRPREQRRVVEHRAHLAEPRLAERRELRRGQRGLARGDQGGSHRTPSPDHPGSPVPAAAATTASRSSAPRRPGFPRRSPATVDDRGGPSPRPSTPARRATAKAANPRRARADADARNVGILNRREEIARGVRRTVGTEPIA